MSAAVNGCGSRRSHLRSSASMSGGPSRSQMACSAAGSSHEANPLSRASKLIPALAAYRLAHSCPLMHSLAV